MVVYIYIYIIVQHCYILYDLAVVASPAVVKNVEEDELTPGDYVVVIKGMFKGYYATVLGEGYGDEIEINYFEKKKKWWTLKENDIDCRERDELKKVPLTKIVVDRRLHTYFE